MWLILVDAMSVALALTSVLTFAVAFALCANVVAEHGAKYKILFGRELVQWTCDDEPNGLQTLAPPEIHVQVLLASGLEHIRDTLTFQPFNGQFTIFLITGEEHHLAHALIQFVDVVHQYLHLRGNRCCRFHFIRFKFDGKGTVKK